MIYCLTGVHTKPECDGSFTDKIDECLETLKKQKKVYDAENKALRVCGAWNWYKKKSWLTLLVIHNDGDN